MNSEGNIACTVCTIAYRAGTAAARRGGGGEGGPETTARVLVARLTRAATRDGLVGGAKRAAGNLACLGATCR